RAEHAHGATGGHLVANHFNKERRCCSSTEVPARGSRIRRNKRPRGLFRGARVPAPELGEAASNLGYGCSVMEARPGSSAALFEKLGQFRKNWIKGGWSWDSRFSCVASSFNVELESEARAVV